MTRFLAICAGGALGSGVRYLVATWLTRGAFPLGTLAVNVLGSLAIGAVMALSLRGAVGDELRFFLVTGVLGGFTTYSAFSYETVSLYQRGFAGLALANVGATLLACFAATALVLWAGGR